MQLVVAGEQTECHQFAREHGFAAAAGDDDEEAAAAAVEEH
jgi:hypothetical protein